LAALAVTGLVSCGQTEHSPTLVSYPLALDPDCRDGRAKIYDQCSNQLDLLNAARARAAAEGKTVLVSYGAEWCIWCHVFDKYIAGEADTFTYTYGEPGAPEKWTDTLFERSTGDAAGEAKALKTFVAEQFVVAHINREFAEASDEVLAFTGADTHYPGWIPYIFAIDADGQYVGQVYHEDVEVRRDTDDWYRGYDRVKMLAILKDLDTGARP
ncbi:MAG: thioredoxin family protein, partial [Pseudomonadota bacterium]